MLQRHALYVFTNKLIICCKYISDTLQRQNVYVAKTTFLCSRDKTYTLQRQNVYVAKTYIICCKDREAQC